MSEQPDDKLIYTYRGQRLEDMTKEQLIDALKVSIRFQKDQERSHRLYQDLTRKVMERRSSPENVFAEGAAT